MSGEMKLALIASGLIFRGGRFGADGEARSIYVKWVEVTFGADENKPAPHVVRAGGTT